MTAYIDTSTGEFPLYAGDIKLRHPNVSWPVNFVPPENYAVIKMAAAPYLPWDKVYVHGGAELVDGFWQQKWVIRDVNQEERDILIKAKWREIRTNRNNLLSSCDWTQLPDCQLNDATKQTWANYRQQLRNITETEDPFAIIWPLAPNK
jgi:hypothetical protein